MPSIAQQDYIVIKPENSGRSFFHDADSLAKIAGAIERNTIFDCLLWQFDDPDTVLSRIITAELGPIGKYIVYYDLLSSVISELEIPYTETQYQGLAAVQQATDELFGLQYEIPQLLDSDTYLRAAAPDGGAFVCVDGKYLIVEKSNSKITSLTIAEIGPGEGDDFVNITWEDAQKLIGLPITAD